MWPLTPQAQTHACCQALAQLFGVPCPAASLPRTALVLLEPGLTLSTGLLGSSEDVARWLAAALNSRSESQA